MPNISVLLPVYNAEKYIEDTVSSILQQTYTDFELIAVDDGSTDRSLELLKSFDDRRLKIYHQKNSGIAATLNTAFRYSSGKFLARIDADDICLPERFSKQIEYLDKHPYIAVVGSAVQYIDSAGVYIARSFPPINTRFICKRLSQGRSCLAHPTVMIRAAAFRESGGYNELIGCGIEDTLIWPKIISCGHLIANIPTPLVQYRISSGSICSIWRDDEYFEIIREILENVNKVPDELAKRFANKLSVLNKNPTNRKKERNATILNNPYNKMYEHLKSLHISDFFCEKIVFSIRKFMDFVR